jgi:hypothetical protein
MSARDVAVKKYVVRLSADEREQLRGVLFRPPLVTPIACSQAPFPPPPQRCALT